MKNRCAALLDYAPRTALRCKLEKGHPGAHQTDGWERINGSTRLLVEMVKRKSERRTSA